MSEQPPRRSFFIGRWQPLHEAHIRLIQTALDEGREVLIGIMDTPLSARNPHSMPERWKMFWDAFGPEVMGHGGRMKLQAMAWIDEVCYGRDCGWGCRRIRLDPETEEQVSGTVIRQGGTG